MAQRPRIVALDIIDTVFRIDALGPAVAAHGLAASDAETLYAGMLRDAMALSLAGSYAPLPEVMAGALGQLRAKRGLPPSDPAREAVAEAMKQLPPHDDAGACFRTLKDAGFRVHALSNGAASATEGLIERAGFAGFFDGVHSVELARRYKPQRSAYMSAVEQMRTEPGDVMLVATHAWDCHGAKQIGMPTGFVRRGQPWPAHFDAPDVAGETLRDVAEAIAAL
ncbi:haloacid dehalogenase type II [Aureimonas leprariae]|uniref:(S)-2-haloacid dehalogenase n=1 Tax=Plantimonas leprariae TaxID=2615207 RepID=A0A7V7PPB2_9HYPH|nr:haloacid dehalogenase type II [Aureimonas leprariae]KAB0679792.1 haloacid dehalogenase type II [Aureimonas leprariae]